MESKIIHFIFFVLIIMFLGGCADATPIQGCLFEEPYGFWSGLWHGFIAPVSFLLSLFMDSVAVYAVNNTGGWYDFGFVLGAGILISSK